MALLRFDSLSFAYPGATARALDNVSFAVQEGGYYVLCGSSGCGKTTLLRQAKRELAQAGVTVGSILYRDVPLSEHNAASITMEVGFVQQNPDNQIVTDFVWHELAFGLENMALPTPVIRRRVSEMASFFGIETWFRQPTRELSGGQKQMLNLASIMAMNPKLLVLDEPTSMLDPMAARTLLDTIKRINRELGVAVLITEHRLEEVFSTADRVLVMERGRLIANAPPDRIAESLSGQVDRERLYFGLPSSVRIFSELDTGRSLPLNVRDARIAMQELLGEREPLLPYHSPVKKQKAAPPVIDARELWFRYSAKGDDILRGLSLTLRRQDFLCLLGGNGAGKTTLLRLLAGLDKPLRGKVKTAKGAAVAMLPQHPQSLFTHDTLEEDLLDSADGDLEAVQTWATRLEMDGLLSRHPFDLSGGEMQRAAMCKLLLRNADTLLLDEPTKGLDAYMKHQLAEILHGLNGAGVSLLIVTHDIGFAAQYAKSCALLFDGDIVSQDEPHAFFAGNRFYTTGANQIAAEYFPDAITCEEVIACCRESFIAKEPLPRSG